MTKKILITGATGNVGYQAIKYLLQNDTKDYQVIAAVRDIERAKRELDFSELEYRSFDFMKIETVKDALKNIDKLFLVRPPAISKVKRYMYPIIDEVKRLNLEQLVFLSLQGVENNPITPHYKVEKYIQELELPYTFLRPSFFMQNLSTTHREEIREDKKIFIPAGKGKTNFIDVRDIGEVAALVLKDDNHINQAYELTGKEVLDYYQVAELLSEELDRDITYEDPSILKFFIQQKSEGLKTTYILVMIGLYTVAKLGKAAETTAELEDLLGREPRSFFQFVTDYRREWI